MNEKPGDSNASSAARERGTPPRPLAERVFDHADAAAPDRPAFTFIDYDTERDGVPHTLSWPELGARMRAVATAVMARSAPGDRVAVLTPQNLDYVTAFLGTLASGRIAVPLFAPEMNAHGARVSGALTDCAPTVWLTSTSAREQVQALVASGEVPVPSAVLCVDEIDDLDPDAAREFTTPSLGPDAPAYLQYTSGSTRAPAGAVITHRAVTANVTQAAEGFGTTAEHTLVGWLPFFHDMGLVQLICLPAYRGARSVFTTPFAFVRKPARWLRMLADYPKTLSAAPNFAFDMAARKVRAGDLEQLDLTGVHGIINGAEPVREPTIQRFAETFAPCGFRPERHWPSYGLAEATVFVATSAATGPYTRGFDRQALTSDRAVPSSDADDAVRLVSAGTPQDQHVAIVADGVVRAEGEVGEIWIHGDNVATGYWNSDDRTEETFRGWLDQPGLPNGPWLRSGDLGVFFEGQLYITGRIKDLIIIDGKNHYPQDIEATVGDAHEAVRKQHVAAFSVDDGDGEAAMVVAEARPDVDLDEVDHAEFGRAVKRAVSQVHDVKLVDALLVPPGGVLRTSSGKIARAATRDRYLRAPAGAAR